VNENQPQFVLVFSRAFSASMFFLVLLLLTLTPAAWAQAAGASITGTVTDPSGAAVSQAKVSVTNMETGATRQVTTDSSGAYRVLALPVGVYEVRVQKPGFEDSLWSGIKLNVGQVKVENVQMALSAAVQEVTVTASVAQAPVVNTTTSQISGLVPEQEIKDLPLNGRGWDKLITLNPGVIDFSTLRSQNTTTSNGNAFSVDGLRPGDNLYLLNSVELTGSSQLGVTPGGVSGAASNNSGGLLGVDAVREFNVLTSTYSAQYGKRAGGQLLAVTNSGSNAIHGTAYEFIRNNVLDAPNFFDRGDAPPFKRNQFGVSMGAPIKKDRLFVFANYEGFRQRLSLSSVSFGPDYAHVDSLTNPVVTSTTADFANTTAGMQKYLAMFPVTTPTDLIVAGPTAATAVAQTFRNPRQSIDEDFGTARLDYVIGPRDTLTGSYTGDGGNSILPQTNPLFASSLSVGYQLFSLQHTHVFSPQVVNAFTFGFSRATFSNDPLLTDLFFQNLAAFNQATGMTVTAADLALVQGRFPGGISINGGLTTTGGNAIVAGPNNASNVRNVRNLYTFADNVQVSKGRHQFNFGVWFQPLQDNEDTASRQLGQASFNSLGLFERGTFSSFQLVPVHTELGWRTFMGAWYAEDVVRVRRNLTVRVGLRHEFDTGWNEVQGRSSQFLIGSPSGVLETTPTVGHSAFTENNAKALFGPRVGLAWDIFGDGSTALQAGFGIHYSMLDALAFQLNSNPPFNGSISVASTSGATPIPFNTVAPFNPNAPIPVQCGPGIPQPCTRFAPQGVQGNVKIPTVEKWNVAIERRLTNTLVLRVGYVGSFGYHELINIDPNTVIPQVCNDPAGCIAGGVQASGFPVPVASTSVVPIGTTYIPWHGTVAGGPTPCTQLTQVGCRPNPFLASGFYWFSSGNSSYHALQIDLTKRYSRQLQFRANYTLSRDFDINSAPTGAQANNQAQMVLNRFNLHQDWGPSAVNPTHAAHFTATYTLPFGHGQRWGSNVRGRADKVVSGWVLNMITTLQSGFPLTPLAGSNISGTGDTRNPDRPSVNTSFNNSVIVGSASRWFDPNAFVLPAAGTFGNVSRGSLTGPGLAELDLSLFKETAIAEGMKLEFRTECFNVLNRANFGTPNLTVFSGGTVNPIAGQISYTATTSRQLQFGLKLIY
jgi:carboxypeptidase family protein